MVGEFKNISLYYDVIYMSDIEYKDETDQIREFIEKYKKSAGNSLLDVACGTGRHMEILKDSYKVCGVDLSENMLEYAKQRLPGTEFFKCNMIDFNLSKSFDIIICMFGSIGFVKTAENLKKAVKCMKKHLLPGGIIILVPWGNADVFKEGVVSTCKSCGEMQVAAIEVIKRKSFDMAEVEYHHLIYSDNKVVHNDGVIEIGLFSDKEYRDAIESAGLTVLERYSGKRIEMGAYVCRL